MVLNKEKRSKNEVLIIILSHNRLDTVIETLMSVINAAEGLADIIVSDNSSDEDVAIQITKRFSDIPIIIQKEAKGAITHLNAAINFALSQSYKYLTIFHDDDLMIKNFVSNSLKDFESNNQLVATACNAYIEMDGAIKRTCYKRAQVFLRSSHVEFLKRYLSLSGNGLAPFPGYMYRLSSLVKRRFDISQGGRHADVSFLNELLKKGDINWRSDVSMVYRVHSGSSGASELIIDRNSQIKYAKKFFQPNKTNFNLLKEFRSNYIIRKKRLSGKSIFDLLINKQFRKISIYNILNLIKARFL
jgi:glycosyltransferase involved in cell wall biosynthesis